MNTLLIAGFWGMVGGLIAWRVGFPGGPTVGAMLGCGLYNLAAGTRTPLPVWFSVSAQIGAGIFVGYAFNRDLLQGGLTIFMWGLIAAASYILLGVILAYIAAWWGGLTFDTALFGFSPGGITGISLIAGAEGADAAKVALIHFMRVVLLFVAIPMLVRLLMSR